MSISASVLPDTLNKAWATDKSRFGFAMLSKMGWSEGKGLGLKEDGMTSHVRVAKRKDALGLGATPANGGGEAALTAAVSDYNALLASLSSSAVGGSGGGGGRGGGGDDGGAAPRASSGGRIIARFARAGVLRQKNVAAYSSADLAAVLGTAVVGAGGAGVAVELPDAPSLKVVHRSEGERKRDKKRARKLEEEEEAAAPEPVADIADEESEVDPEAALRRAARKWAKRAARAAAKAAS
jgi:hypothetical protein